LSRIVDSYTLARDADFAAKEFHCEENQKWLLTGRWYSQRRTYKKGISKCLMDMVVADLVVVDLIVVALVVGGVEEAPR
jgi:hypothetical protein